MAVHDQEPPRKGGLSRRDIELTVQQVLSKLHSESRAVQHEDSEAEESDARSDFCSEEGEDGQDFSPTRKSAKAYRSRLWKGFSDQIHRTVPSLPDHLPPDQAETGRLVPMSQFAKPEQDMLPMHPNISQALGNCEKELRSADPKPANKTDGKAGQYDVGAYFSTQSRKVFPRFFVPLGTPSFGKAMEARTKLTTVLDKAVTPPDAVRLSDKDLKEQEVEIKRMISIQSVMHWGHDALENITDQLSKGADPQSVVTELKVLLDEQKEALPIMEDCLCTALTNTVLRRRDLVFRSVQVQDLSPEALVTLRSSSLTGTELIPVDDDLIRSERKHKSEQTLYHFAKAAASSATVTATASRKSKGGGHRKGQKAQQTAPAQNQPYQQQQQGKGRGRGKGKAYSYVGYQRVGQQAAQTQPAQGAKGANQGSKGRGKGGKGGKQTF